MFESSNWVGQVFQDTTLRDIQWMRIPVVDGLDFKKAKDGRTPSFVTFSFYDILNLKLFQHTRGDIFAVNKGSLFG
jgi:hypothetical protein